MIDTQTASSYVLPLIMAVAFHIMVGVAVNFQWKQKDVVTHQPDRPMYLNANLVMENPIKAKQRDRQKAAEKRRLERIRANKIEATRRKRLEEAALKEKKLKEEIKQEDLRKQTDKPAEMKVPQPDLDKQQQEKERKLMEQRLAEAISTEQNAQIAVTDDEKAQAYVGLIKRQIIQNWSRPPSARNGMEALLKVFLVPTGEVVNVVIIESSGNDAFDRSAVQAVRKAQQFDVPPDSREFERNFREFTVLFRPEDLRL